ncbi:hypothetical protein XM38_012330 [Halomicronema hongdechloris C2206]|uniref:Uncharacterized protein n=1 Tax=Halomicronema hongdechloris C2206 TaxID=1641165 RepID=A0A1Z3HJ56_9CYAN|nr:hypothetical protein [Halomicronema hongdechloris]ASC70296.1 hypothetical protein XM38_012330 [Halomicronema hongdechloris C2206]
MTIDELRDQLQVYEIPGHGWHWETEDFCSEDGHPTRGAAISNFEAEAPSLLQMSAPQF